jgi:hypothetical protein
MLEPSHNDELPPIPGKRYFTIGGARLRLSGDEAKEDTTQYRQLIRQTIAELEDVLQVLRK